MPWRAIVFDLDDTLYPERQYAAGGLRAAAAWAERRLGLPAARSFEELWRLFEQGVRSQTFDRWLADRGLAPQRWVAGMVEAYRRHAPAIEPYAGVSAMLEDLGRDFRLGLVSDGYLDVQRRKLESLGLAGYFQAVVFSDALGREAWKPSPLPFRQVLEQLGAAPAEAVYVADNPAKDFRGPRALGMATVRVRHAEGLYRRLEPAAPEDAADMEINALDQLPAIARERAPRRA